MKEKLMLMNVLKLNIRGCFVEWLITELMGVYHRIHHNKGFAVIIPVTNQVVFPLQAQKEVLVHQLITARRVLQAQCPAQLGPTPTSLASRRVPAVPLDTSVPRGLTTSPSFLAPLDSIAPMVDQDSTFTSIYLLKKTLKQQTVTHLPSAL